MQKDYDCREIRILSHFLKKYARIGDCTFLLSGPQLRVVPRFITHVVIHCAALKWLVVPLQKSSFNISCHLQPKEQLVEQVYEVRPRSLDDKNNNFLETSNKLSTCAYHFCYFGSLSLRHTFFYLKPLLWRRLVRLQQTIQVSRLITLWFSYYKDK